MGKARFIITIEFLPISRAYRFELKSMRLRTKPMTWAHAQSIAEDEIERSKWPADYCKASIRRLARVDHGGKDE